MGSKGGGSVDTSGLEEATNRSIDLQKEIYDLTREDVQPWYRMGTGAVSRLSDLLGISGGSVQSREQIMNELTPQYTTEQVTGGAGGSNMYISPSGHILDLSGTSQAAMDLIARGELGRGGFSAAQRALANGETDLSGFGYTAVNPQTTTSNINTEGLNAAVDARMAQQGETPDDYGSLLQRFGMDQFEEDPGYQFRKDEANRALERQMAAQGVTLGGAGAGDINATAYRGMQELNQNLASQEYGNAYNRYVQDQLNTFNMLTQSAGMGQGSTGILATGGQNYATNVGQLTTGLASAQQEAQMANQSSGGMFGGLLGAGVGAFLGNPGFGSAAGKAIFG